MRSTGWFDITPATQERTASAKSIDLSVEHNLPGHDTTDIEEIVHEAGHVEDLPLNDVTSANGAGLSKFGEAKHLHRTADRPQRIAQLVAEHREKFILGLAFPLHLGQRAQIRHDQGAVFPVVHCHGADRDTDVDRCSAS